MISRLGLGLLIVGLGACGNTAVVSSIYVNPANGHEYVLLDYNSWSASEAEAQLYGGHLVTINDAAENDWVYNTFVSIVPYSTLWIGLNDAASEGNFVWSSGEPVSYTNWQVPDQPDNARGDENYAHIWTPSVVPQAPWVVRQWNDLRDDGFGLPTYGVVEGGALHGVPPPTPPTGPVPEPSSLLTFGLTSVWFAKRKWDRRAD